MPRDPIEISAITLIDKALEFADMLKAHPDWNLNQLKLNTSYEIRYRQLDVLIKYFIPEIYHKHDLKTSLQRVITGNFIEMRPITTYKNLLPEMDKTILSAKITMPQKQPWRIDHILSNYCDLIAFKQKMNTVLNHKMDYMEISYPYLFSVEISDQIIRNIDTSVMDKFIGRVIDPLGRIVHKATLIKDFNYPEEDVYSVDLDNW